MRDVELLQWCRDHIKARNGNRKKSISVIRRKKP